jgi:hypothetical protein
LFLSRAGQRWELRCGTCYTVGRGQGSRRGGCRRLFWIGVWRGRVHSDEPGRAIIPGIGARPRLPRFAPSGGRVRESPDGGAPRAWIWRTTQSARSAR